MYRKYYKRDEDIFESAAKLGNLAIGAHKVGGMPLVFAIAGIFCLVFSFVLIMIKFSIVWTIILIVFTIAFFTLAVVLHIRISRIEEKKIIQVCPYCGKELILKTGKFGKFYACPGYPNCKFTKSTG